MNKNIFIFILILILLSCKENFNFYTINKNLKIGVDNNIILLSYRDNDNEELLKELTKKKLRLEKLDIRNDKINSNKFTFLKKDNGFIISDFLILQQDNSKIVLSIKNTKKIYGLGQRLGKLNLLDEKIKYKIYNEHRYGDRAIMPIPVIFTNTGKAIYFASPYKAFIEFEKIEDYVKIIYTNEKNNKTRGVDIYIIDSNNLINASKEYSEIFGYPYFPPKWIFGYIQSKYGYFSQKETLNIAKKFIELKLPATGIVLDLYWFRYMGDIDWYKRSFPDPINFIKDLDKMGFKLINISEPFFDLNSKNFNFFKNLNYFGMRSNENKFNYLSSWWGKGAIFDFTNKIACSHLWNISYAPLIKQGISGLWTDLGEPENVPSNTEFKLGKEEDIHNLYNYYWSKMLFENWDKNFLNKRIVILSRSGWSCSPSLGVTVWSGDASAKWLEGLSIQPSLMISASLCNFSYWASDVGGFVGEGNAELYTRWSEFGLFSPVYRPHGANIDREPWAFGEETLKKVKNLLKLRARLHPYIYSIASNTSFNGIPFIRPIEIEENILTKDKEREIENLEYYFGESILYRIANNENNKFEVYLPENGEYLEYQSQKFYTGRKVYSVDYNLGYPPFFLKPNAILVTNPSENYNELDKYEIIINNGNQGRSNFIIYDDDGITASYKNGIYNSLKIENNFYSNKIEIILNPLNTKYDRLPELNFIIYLKNITNAIMENIDYTFNKEKQTIIFKVSYPEKEKNYNIKLN